MSKLLPALILTLAGCYTDPDPGTFRCGSNGECPAGQVCGVSNLCVSPGCPSYPAAGGMGMNRPDVLVPKGMATLDRTPYAVSDFYLDVFLVTVAAYRNCVVAGVCTQPGTIVSCNWTIAPGLREDHPINCVTLAQASAFCQWAGRRLPGEAELAYAASGMSGSMYPWGNDDPKLGNGQQLCWNRYDGANPLGTCSVDIYPRTLLGAPTCMGVADLGGNVWEWTSAQYQSPYVRPEIPCGPTSPACTIRGGSCYQNMAADFRVANRGNAGPMGVRGDVGFRCARSAM